jgi:hypothetical protein
MVDKECMLNLLGERLRKLPILRLSKRKVGAAGLGSYSVASFGITSVRLVLYYK